MVCDLLKTSYFVLVLDNLVVTELKLHYIRVTNTFYSLR